MPNASYVTIKIYDLLGKEIKTLVDETQNKGYQSVEWNGRNNINVEVVSGIYLYMMEATDINNQSNKFIQANRMLLIR